MPGERVQRQVDRLLDEAESALAQRDWIAVRERARDALALDPDSEDARSFLAAANRALGTNPLDSNSATPLGDATPITQAPDSFSAGRYRVQELLGEGAKKRVYRAHDTLLDREVAFALIKTDGLDDAGRERVRREARAMGRLGSHPNIVSVLDLGEEPGQPYLVTELLTGGDLGTYLASMPEHRMPIDEVLSLGKQVARALEHAHTREIIHRDLKPGNIWMSDDGTAKLGDFGLAVALDQTRHTQPGMMIGTVSYMAPEQAIGGNVDARSDLYALGCVLYELVCGRPPFVGDESVAIITQHLNTPPVVPTWHRPDVPASLDALIMRLLEKDPANRPQEASQVGALLTGIDRVANSGALQATAAGSEDAPADIGPLYQRAFIGREAELRQLEQAYDQALSGRGGLVMVVGEPGIGKTSLSEQLATYVTVRGGLTLVGHCYEEGSHSLPYLPFVESMRSFVLTRDPDQIRSALGSGASDIARIVSEVRDQLQVEPREPGPDPDEDRYRLLQAVTSFLRNAASIRPLVLVLEDLHWADGGTLDLLQHIARQLSGARLLLVGTYRDVEVDRAHPLSSTLAELRRGAGFSRVLLRGLTVDEVHRMMQTIRGQDVPWSRAEAIHRQTEGNPLFVQEVLRFIVEEGILVREGGRWVRADDGSPESGIPEGLRDVIGKRLNRLSPTCNQVLGVAAVIGREFRLDVLQSVSQIPEAELFAALEEAVNVSVVEQRTVMGTGVTFRFMHALFRQTLYEELFAPRRIRLHQQVARALEDAYARRLPEHAAELAEHFAQSTELADLQKALHYSVLGAQRAHSVFAYVEAARLWEQALHVQEVIDPDDDADRCRWLLDLGEELLPAGESQRAVKEVAEEAFRLAEQLGDHDQIARACAIAGKGMIDYGGSTGFGFGSPEAQVWVDRADRYARPEHRDRAAADAMLATTARSHGDEKRARELSWRAARLALQLNDLETLAISAGPLIGGNTTPPEFQRERIELLHEIADLDWQSMSARSRCSLLNWFAFGYLTAGERDEAERVWEQINETASRSTDAQVVLYPSLCRALRATFDGSLEEVVQTGQRVLAQAEQLGRAASGRQLAGTATRRALFFLGRNNEVLSTIPAASDLWSVGGVYEAQRADYLALTGRVADATAILDRFIASRQLGERDDPTSAATLRYLLEASAAAQHRPMIETLLPRMAPLSDLLHTEAFMVFCMGRLLGDAAALLGKTKEARRFYLDGLQACERARFRPELALCHLGLAELLAVQFPADHVEASEHLDFAIGELRAMGMTSFLERALRLKMQSQGVDSVTPSTSIDAVSRAVEKERPRLEPHAAPDGTVTLLFTDIENSTGLTVELGDERWLEVLRAHHALVREQVQTHGGFEVKSQGDGFMLAFQSARRALACAIAIQRAVAATHLNPPIRVRMGLHTGEALKDADDFHGRDVVLAARIANQARGGEILVSALLKELLSGRGDVQFDGGREAELKGLAGIQRMYAVNWS